MLCVSAEFKLFSAGEVSHSSARSRHVTAGARSWKIGSVIMFICSDITFYDTVMQHFPRLLECVVLYFFHYFFKRSTIRETVYNIDFYGCCR